MGCWKRISFKHGDYNLKILGVFYQKTYGVFPKTYGEFFKTRRVLGENSACFLSAGRFFLPNTAAHL